MRTLTIMLIFNYFLIMHADDNLNTDVTTDTRTLFESDIKTLKEAEKLLVKIEANEVLPLIFFTDSKAEDKIIIPDDIDHVVITNGRIVKGTEFKARYDDGNQKFLCPKVNSDETCFVLTNFEASKMLKCPEIEQAMPILQPRTYLRWCGPGGVGEFYNISYDICLEDKPLPPEEKLDAIFYEACFENNQKKTLYTRHIIMSPKLLDSKLLLREREMKYKMIENDQMKPSNYQKVKDFFDGAELLHYKAQLLVPPEDMPFALWRRTTYQYVNAELQHEALFPLWNDINEYVRSYALKLYRDTNGGITLRIYTGVVEVSPSPRDDNQTSNMWVKIVHTLSLKPQQGIAILMNNFIDKNNDEFKSSEENFNKYCKEDLCVSALKNKFKRVKGHIRCCALTPEVAQLFGIRERRRNKPILEIPSINKSKIAELHDEFMKRGKKLLKGE